MQDSLTDNQDPATEKQDARRPIRALVFDFDGTLTDGGTLDFAQIRRDLDIPPGAGILRALAELPPELRRDAEAYLHAQELSAAAASRPRETAESFVRDLAERGVPRAVLTRNTRAAVKRSLENFELLSEDSFDRIISRDDTHAYKPSPAGILALAEMWEIPPESIAVIGDFQDDVTAALAAGSYAIYLAPPNAGSDRRRDERAHFNAATFPELRRHVEDLLVLPDGKVPAEFLQELFDAVGPGSPRELLLGPGIGIDAAAVALPGGEQESGKEARGNEDRGNEDRGNEDRVLVVASDPITFPTDKPTEYLVTINENDLYTSGAVPEWCTVTALFPPNTAPFQLRAHLRTLQRIGTRPLHLVGGHTEVSAAVRRPVFSMTIFGSVARERLRRPQHVRPGDMVIMTKTAGIEGTAILASEFTDRLRHAGVENASLERAADFADRLSIAPEALLLRRDESCRWMHDVTEGGVIGALREAAHAVGRRLEVDPTAIPVAAETTELCGLLGLDPRGLIGSGSLLAFIAPEEAESTLGRLRDAGIPATSLGQVLPDRIAEAASRDAGLRSCREDAAIPLFPRDELARL
jgi:HAD superfamily hydrolase (TIGR01509 family)